LSGQPAARLGFGRSDKPNEPELYRIPATSSGGAIGLSWAVAHPDRVERLFILNTYAHRPTFKGPIPIALRAFRAPGIGAVMVKGLNLFVRGFMFHAGVVHRARLTADVRHAYRAPNPNWSSRTGMLVFPREVPTGPDGPVSDLTGALEHALERHFRDRPVTIAWAMKDPAFTPRWLDELWLKRFPDARVIRLPDAGHFLQEDAHEQIVP
jgi:haloalkane dehalogenase